MRFSCRRLVTVLTLASASIVSACHEPVGRLPNYPDATDVQAAQEAKPEPPLEILTDEQAAAWYDANVESWGDRVHDAGVRMCRSLKEAGAPYPFPCGETSSERNVRLGINKE